MPQAQDLIGRLLEEFMAAHPEAAQPDAFVAFSRKFLTEIPVTGLVPDISGMALQLADGTRLLLCDRPAAVDPADVQSDYSVIGGLREKPVPSLDRQRGADRPIFGSK